MITTNLHTGEELHRVEGEEPDRIVRISERLAGMYLVLGEGNHNIHMMVAALPVNHQATRRTCRDLATMLPPQAAVFGFDRNGSPSEAYFGPMSLVWRRATPDERTAAGLPRIPIPKRPPKLSFDLPAQRKLHELEEAEVSKRDLTTMDHAVVTVPGETYHLDIDSPDAVITARLLETLASGSVTTPSGVRSWESLKTFVWQRMSLAERALFTDSGRIILAASGPIRSQLEACGLGAVNAMEVIKAVRGAGHFSILHQKVRLQYEPEPPASQPPDGMRRLQPGGISDLAYRPVQPVQPTDEQIGRAAEALQAVPSALHTNLAPEVGRRVLAATIGRTERAALAVVLAEDTAAGTLDEAVFRLQRAVRRSLEWPDITGIVRERTLADWAARRQQSEQ